MVNFTAVILAAGQGKRMRSSLPKMLHPLGGMPLLERIINTVKKLKPHHIIIVYGHQGEALKNALNHIPDVMWVLQAEQKGTGHAALQTLPYLKEVEEVLILNGDVPLISEETLTTFLECDLQNALGVITAKVENPQGLGRIIRNTSTGEFLKIVEDKDASVEEKKSTEINTGIWRLLKRDMESWLPKLSTQNAQQEYYLTDIIPFAQALKRRIVTFSPRSFWEGMGVNDQGELAMLERYFQTQQAETLMKAGLTLLDPHRFDLRGELKIGTDVVIDVNVVLTGTVSLGDRVNIGPNVLIKNSIIHEDAQVLANSVIEGATIGAGSIVGPFARVRPETELSEDVRVGNFVEVKKAKIGKGTKINHLSYVGDAELGQRVNVGAGTITCNYDGKDKHLTVIGDGVFIGSNTQLIAPVTVGDRTTIGAGTTVVKNVPADSLIHNRIEHRLVTPWVKSQKQAFIQSMTQPSEKRKD